MGSDDENASLETSLRDTSTSISSKPLISNGLAVSASQPFLAVVNGIERNRRNFPTNDENEPQPSPLKRAKKSSNDSSGIAQELANQLNIELFTKSAPVLDEVVSDDLELNAMSVRHHSPAVGLPTGLCYDVRMRYHCELDPPKQRLDFHPEDPRRIYCIYRELCKAGLVDDIMSTRPLVPTPLKRVSVRSATQAEICLVHDRKHFEFVESTKNMSEEMLVHLERQYDSVYFNKLTYDSALLSTGGAIETCRAVVGQQLKNAIAVIRPPGHHAECNRPMGFCLFDNVSIAAKVCQLDYPEECRKILIVDWDVHHGNGIQQAFYRDPNVLYISIHVHEDGNFYPPGPYGDHMHCGAEPGLGKNINIPWPTKGMGDADYLYAFQHLVMPVAYDFNPDLVIIAAGFDAAAGDQLGGCFVSPTCYAHMTHMLMSLANGKLVVCLEGGYNLQSISKCALAVTRTLMGEPPDRIVETTATTSCVSTVQEVKLYQSRFWPCLHPREIDQDTMRTLGGERMHDIIRYYQSARLYERHKMINLTVFRDKLSNSFEKQVMATRNYHKAIPLVVIFHDPPEIMGAPDPGSRKLELHNTWLADELKHYIDWATKKGFGVIDVNIPKHLTGLNDATQEDGTSPLTEMEELAIYLWENYIDCNESTDIFFIGVGQAYHSIMHLLNNRDAVVQRTQGIVHFVASEALEPIHDENIYYLSKWYRSNSIVFVAHTHLVWDLQAQKKPSKRFGTLVQSPQKGLNDMLIEHRNEVQEFILRKLGSRNGDEADST